MFAGCKYFGYMVGDRRCCDTSGKIVSEDVEKVRKINENLIFAAAGNASLILSVYRYLNSQKNLLFDDAVKLLELNYGLIYDHLLELIKKETHNEDIIMNANIGLMSIFNDAVMFSSIHLLNRDIQIKNISHKTEEDITMCFLGSGNGLLGKKFHEKFIKSNIFSVSNLESIFKKVVDANIFSDNTINNRIISESLFRDDIYNKYRECPK